MLIEEKMSSIALDKQRSLLRHVFRGSFSRGS